VIVAGANPETVETECGRPVEGVARVWGDPVKIPVGGVAAGVNGVGLAGRVYPPPDAPIEVAFAGGRACPPPGAPRRLVFTGGIGAGCYCCIKERVDWIPVSIPFILPSKVSRRQLVAAMSARRLEISPVINGGTAACVGACGG
jgi:hypothetical protein